MSFKVKRLHTKVTLLFIAIAIVVSTGFNLTVYFRDRSNRMGDLQFLVGFTAERLSKSFATPLWDMESEQLRQMIRFEMAEKQIFAILVKGTDDKSLLAGAKRNSDWEIIKAETDVEGDYLMEKRPITKNDETLAHVYVYFTDRFVLSDLRMGFLIYSILTGVLILILIVALFFILRKFVVKPVSDVVDFTERLNQGDLAARLTEGDDEIGRMISALNGFAANLQRAVDGIGQSMNAVAASDLTKHITIHLQGDLDQLKTSINESINMLARTIAEVAESSERVKTGATEISSSADTLAKGTSQQAAAIEQMTSLVHEFSSQTKLNNDNAGQAQQLSNQTLEIVQRGNSQMESMLNSIGQINETSTEVSKVIKVIDEIAFQTNLLALNAAVEAARAGKYGKGFAVVAEEVRNLASRSADAAKNTTDLIQASISEVEKGVKNADLTAAVLNEISAAIEKTNDLVGEISSASKEQATGIEEINKGLNQVNEIVQQNSSISEETASSSEELSSQATQLQKLMSAFILQQRGASSARTTDVRESFSPEPQNKQLPEKDVHMLEERPDKSSRTIYLDDGEYGKY